MKSTLPFDFSKWMFWSHDEQKRIEKRFLPFEWTDVARKNFVLHMTFFALLLLVTPAWSMSGDALDALVPAIIAAESSGNPNAVGDEGKARGLMQIQKGTWERFSGYSWDDAFDPEKNVQTGRALLEFINEEYENYRTDGVAGVWADKAHVVYTYNTGRYCFGVLPAWTKRHPNKIYRRIFNG